MLVETLKRSFGVKPETPLPSIFDCSQGRMAVKNLLSKNFAFFSYDFVVQTSPGFDGLDNPSK